MSSFLNTSATNYFLEELIKNASERLILISPFLKLNEKIKELLEDKNRLKIDVRIIYGKNEMQPNEIKWLRTLEYVRTSFCSNLHAKCYINEHSAIITSLNLYEFSQVNNNEMGVNIDRQEDAQLYNDTYSEAQRIIRISEEVRISIDEITKKQTNVDTGKTLQEPAILAKQYSNAPEQESTPQSHVTSNNKVSSSRIAQKLNMTTSSFINKMVELGYLHQQGSAFCLSQSGKDLGAEHVKKSRFGEYFKWPEDMSIN